MKISYACVVTQKPGGTATPAGASLPLRVQVRDIGNPLRSLFSCRSAICSTSI